jgi:hypothetical protein
MGDMTITVRAADANTLPPAALRLISLYCGVLFPDREGNVRMELSPRRWEEICGEIERGRQ